MCPTVSVERIRGLPPVVIIDATRLPPTPPNAHVQEILVVVPEPSLRQSLRLVADSLKVLLRCTCRLCRNYVLIHRNGYAYANHWYTRDASAR